MLTVFNCGHTSITIGIPTRGHRPPRERCRRDISQQTRAQPLLVVQERGFESAQILDQTSDMLVPLVVEEECCGAGAVAGAQKWSTSRARWRSRSAQQILDVSVHFISEQRLERITMEGPLILKMTAEAVQSPVAQILERGRRRAWCNCWNAFTHRSFDQGR